jgi:hypothetical protein
LKQLRILNVWFFLQPPTTEFFNVKPLWLATRYNFIEKKVAGFKKGDLKIKCVNPSLTPHKNILVDTV